MKVSNLIPKNLYKNNIEMINIINSEDEEFENHIHLDIDNAFNDNFIKTATETGIEKYEKLLNIPTDDKQSIEYRRDKVIIKLITTVPYTYNRLLEILDTYCGKNNYTINQNIDEYTVKIITHFFDIIEVQNLLNLLKEMFPANIKIEITNSNIVDITGNIKIINNVVAYEIINI